MPIKKADPSPREAGVTYEILVTKLGPDDGWTQGETIQAEDYPDLDFARMEANGSIRRVDAAPVEDPTSGPTTSPVQAPQSSSSTNPA